MALALRQATADDWYVFLGVREPKAWAGLVAVERDVLVGFGGVCFGVDDRWWAYFRKLPGVRATVTSQKAARLILSTVAEAGLPIHAQADPRIPGAENWLRHLGFVASEEILEGERVWIYG
jgi:hypothetical protein